MQKYLFEPVYAEWTLLLQFFGPVHFQYALLLKERIYRFKYRDYTLRKEFAPFGSKFLPLRLATI